MEPDARKPLPFMKTNADALAVCQRENDNFFMTAFMIEAWLGAMTLEAAAEYAEKKSAKDRRMQQGAAARLFDETFGHVSDDEVLHLFQSLLRFAEFDDPQSRVLLKAYGMLALEHPVSTWPEVSPPANGRRIAEVVSFMRGVMRRICEWVEALTHARTHVFHHLSPVAFDPDPEKRELAILGIQHRRFPGMSDFQKAWWEWHHGEAAGRLGDSSKWRMVGKGMADHSTRHHNYPALDECIILFWPLLRRHNWTHRDLMNVIRSVAPVPLKYPCECEQALATYCINVLGLRKIKTGKTGKSHPAGEPAGFEVARALCSRSGPAGSS